MSSYMLSLQTHYLTLVCAYHHQFAQRGWRCRVNDHGLPVWFPPRWIDRHQRPILSAQITLANWDLHDPLDVDPTPVR
jgi:hypothetical protein